MSDTYFGRGTTPERVAEAIERATKERKPTKAAPTTAERERFFAKIADERKRAEGG
jgi:acyl-CoA reductase-like NAD-dependent aldehyde dehydrogenase